MGTEILNYLLLTKGSYSAVEKRVFFNKFNLTFILKKICSQLNTTQKNQSQVTCISKAKKTPIN